MPLLLDCQKSLASLGAKYAATLLVGEPLSPEERMHSEELESLAPTAEADGLAAWERCRIPASIRAAVYERRQRRATSPQGQQARVRQMERELAELEGRVRV